MMNILVTGGTGMVGSHFMRMFRKHGHTAWGIARYSASSRMQALQDESILRCDILERDALARVFTETKPYIVIHMAAQAFNGESWNSEYTTHMTNYIGTLNVLWCAKNFSPDAKILLACSYASYGNILPEDCPLKEDRLLKPHTPYGISKAGAEQLGRQYALNYGMKVYLPRMFIHVGTGHPPATAIQNFARQLALIKAGKLQSEVHAGVKLQTAKNRRMKYAS